VSEESGETTDPRILESIDVGWGCMKDYSSPEIMLWIGGHGWKGAWHITAQKAEREGYVKLNSHRHEQVGLTINGLSLN
jgi:hypothetical protein